MLANLCPHSYQTWYTGHMTEVVTVGEMEATHQSKIMDFLSPRSIKLQLPLHIHHDSQRGQ